MLRRILERRTFSCLPNALRAGYARTFTNEAAKEGVNDGVQAERRNTESPREEFKLPEGQEQLSRLLDEAATYSDAKNNQWATSPYPEGAAIDPDILASGVDPKETCVLIFPGQGIISAGLVKKYLKFPNAKEIFQVANEILGYDLLKICLEGPQEKLNRTQFNQPATVVSSLAALEKLREESPDTFEKCVAAAGYSVGEISALIFSGAISIENGIRLVAVRGAAMQHASGLRPQGMLSIHCTPSSKVSMACRDAEQWARDLGVDDPVCRVAIYVYTESKILAGDKAALDFVEQNAEKYNLTKVQRLPVSGAFHTQLMEPALKSYKKAVYSIPIEEPRCRVYSNYKVKLHMHEANIRRYLIKQVVQPVRWEQTMQKLYSRKPGLAYPKTYDVCSRGRMKSILSQTNAKAADGCVAI